MPKANIITAGVLSEADRLKVQLCQSVRAPGLNPQNMFLLLATLLEQEFSNTSDRATAARFVAFVKGRHPSGMGLDPKQLLKIVTDLKHPHEVTPHRDKALKARMDWMRRSVAELVETANPVMKAAEVTAAPKLRDKPGRPKAVGNGSKIENRTIRGTTAAYRLAILKRDYPVVARRYAAGEFKSVSAAERAAGIRETNEPDMVKAHDRVWQKATEAEREAIRRKVCNHAN